MGVCATAEPTGDEVDSNYADIKLASNMLTDSRNAQSINMTRKAPTDTFIDFNQKTRLKTKIRRYKNYRIAFVKAYLHHIRQLLNNRSTDRIPTAITSTILNYFPLYYRIYGMGKNLLNDSDISDIQRLHLFESELFTLENIYCGHNRYFIKTYDSAIYAIGNNSFDGLCTNMDIENSAIYNFHHVDSLYNYLNYVDQDQSIEFVSSSIFSNDLVIKLKNGSIYISSLILDDRGAWKRVFAQPQFDDLSMNENLSITQIKCGMLHSLVLADNGTVYAFGKNDSGQCGLGYVSKKENAVKIITSLITENVRITAIDCGQHHSLAIDEDDNLWCFGSNEHNQCSPLNSMNSVDVISKPTKVCFDFFEELKSNKIMKAECGQSFTVYLTAKGYYGGFGKMIVSTLDRMNITEWKTKGMMFKDLSCGSNHVLLIGDDDCVYTHGSNEFGKCGLTRRSGKTNTPHRLDPGMFDDFRPCGVRAGMNSSMIFFSSVSQ